eukprot:PhM_4_TR11956/c0_g1_i1/m.87318/K15285/SLC35E3; solute carrier family 35, member E3
MVNAYLMFSLCLNVISSVGVIFINKRLVFGVAEFHFGTALTMIHFLVTFMGCLLFARYGFFEIKRVEVKRVMSICFAFCGYVVFNNLSLLYNSVTIYQISKILCTPVIVAVEWHVYGKRQTRETLLALLPVCLGIFITVYADTTINPTGAFWAGMAIVANSLYTIWGKTKMQELNLGPMQILTYQAPISFVILLFCVPFFDPVTKLMVYPILSTKALLCIGASCVFAFGVNFSFFLFVSQTSPLTTNVLGYLKTALVFVGGFVFFDDALTVQNVLGITVTLVGLAMYSAVKSRPLPSTVTHEGNNDKV